MHHNSSRDKTKQKSTNFMHNLFDKIKNDNREHVGQNRSSIIPEVLFTYNQNKQERILNKSFFLFPLLYLLNFVTYFLLDIDYNTVSLSNLLFYLLSFTFFVKNDKSSLRQVYNLFILSILSNMSSLMFSSNKLLLIFVYLLRFIAFLSFFLYLYEQLHKEDKNYKLKKIISARRLSQLIILVLVFFNVISSIYTFIIGISTYYMYLTRLWIFILALPLVIELNPQFDEDMWLKRIGKKIIPVFILGLIVTCLLDTLFFSLAFRNENSTLVFYIRNLLFLV